MDVAFPNLGEQLNKSGWQFVSENTSPDYKDVYLKCEYMGAIYVAIGKLKNGGTIRVKSDADPELFYRSRIAAWKPLY